MIKRKKTGRPGRWLFFVIVTLWAITVWSSMVPRENGHKWVVKWHQPVPSFWEEAELLEEGKEGGFLVRIKPGVDEDRWLKKWKEDPRIKDVSPDIRYHLGDKKNKRGYRDIFDKNYYLQQTRIPKAWEYFRSKADPETVQPVTVAVVDTGVDLSHPDLQPFLTEGANVKNPGLSPQDHFGHGTKVAGVIASVWGAREGKPVGKGKIMPIKVMENGNDGEIYYTVKGIREAIRRDADIIVLSQGSWTYSKLMEEAVDEAEKQGVLMVAAGGNAEYDERGQVLFRESLYYPAKFPSVLSVGATNYKGKQDPLSNSGPGLDLMAPGEMIYTMSKQHDYAFDSGTSFSAPQVAGVAALIWQLHPDYTPGDLRMLLRQTASKPDHLPRWDNHMGYGMLDADRAIRSPLKRDATEPNDSEQTAVPFSFSQEINLLLDKEDPDWYFLQVEKAGRLSIDLEVTGAPEEDVLLDVKQSATQETISHSFTGKSVRHRVTIPVSPGKTLLKWSVPKASRHEVTLRFHASFLPADDEFEENDMLSQAALLTIPSGEKAVYTATISKPGDRDWYQLSISEKGKLMIQIQPLSPRFDPVVFKVQKDNWEKMRWDEEREGRLETLSLTVEPGPFYFRVTDYAGNMIEESYQVRVSFEPR